MDQDSERASLLRELWDETVAIGIRLLDIPMILVALALTFIGAVVVLLIPAQSPVAVAIGGTALLAVGVPWSLWRASLARRELRKMAELYARHGSVAADPAATRDLPPAILRPEDATDTAHLDRILARNRSDWPEPESSYRLLTLAGALLVVLMLVCGTVMAAGVIALVMSRLSPDGDATLAVRGALSLALVFPAITVSRIAASMRDLALIDEAAQWDRAQQLLDAGALADNGSELRLIHRGAKLLVAVRRASYALRPQSRHFKAARRGVVRARVSGLTLGLILVAVAVTVAILAAARG